MAYAASLRQQIDRVDNAFFHERYVSDEAFDRWILAVDTVVLPYREIFSSGVLERANLLGRPVIASRVGGLEDQLEDGSSVFANDDELVELLQAAAGEPDQPASAVPPLELPADPASLEAYLRSSLPARPIRVLDLGDKLVLPAAALAPSAGRPDEAGGAGRDRLAAPSHRRSDQPPRGRARRQAHRAQRRLITTAPVSRPADVTASTSVSRRAAAS